MTENKFVYYTPYSLVKIPVKRLFYTQYYYAVAFEDTQISNSYEFLDVPKQICDIANAAYNLGLNVNCMVTEK